MKFGFSMKSNKDEIEEAMMEQLHSALEAIGADAASTAANIPDFPVDTGNLRNSIGYAVDGTTVYVGTDVEYAVYHELGTRKGITARHFLQFGVQAHDQEYKDICEEYLKGHG